MSQTPVTNLQPTLTMAEYIDTAGAFPPRDGGGDGPFLGEIDISAANPDIFAFPAEGQTLAINRYEADFSIIGTYYGGDGIRSFQLPNLSGAEMIGTGQGTGLPNYVTGESTGTASNTILPADVPSSLGGGGQTLNNDQPSVAITYAINATGIYPSGTLSSGTIGVVTAFAGNFPPGSELACNGQLLSISQYEALYNVIGTTYGGDGITTFALPNLMGRDIVGSGQNPVDGTNYVLGQDVGAATVGISKANLPASGDQPIDNVQPGLAMNYYIATTGVFPSNPTAEGAPSGEAYIGQIFAFAGDLSDPDGCLPCAGQLLQIQQYQALYALLGNTYGGDGVTTFALPDLRGKSILGVGASNPEGQEQGSATTALVNADFTPPSVGSLTSNPTDAVQGGAGVAVLAATPTGLTAAMTNGDLQSVTVTIAKPQIGDLLGVGGNFTLSGTATAFTTSNGGNFLATYINGVLEIANTAGVLNTVAQYEAAMALVDYEDAGTDASTSQHPTRTLDWVANDGIQNSATATSSIVIDRPPVLTPETVTVQLPIGGATDSTNDQGVLAPAFASDLDGDPLTVSAVNGASGSVGAAVAGVDGTLTLNANGSFSYQLTGLASPTDSFSYTVSDGKGGTATQTLTFDAPAAVAPQIVVMAPPDHSATLTSPVNPFAGDAVIDENGAGVIDTLTVTPSLAADGALSDPNAASDGSSVDPTTGAYTISGTADAVTNALDGLVYTPAANTAGDVTVFTISDASAVNPVPVSDSTTQVTDIPCYARGSRILTERGEVAVEDLCVGDLVVTAAGPSRPIRWIGHRKVDCLRHPQPRAVWPYRVRAGAFGEGAPMRDLWLSPEHCVAFEGALIPIRALANGVSVAQVECAAIEYWHVELDAHAVLLAEGLPAESYLDTGNRTSFVNGGAFVDAHPDFQRRRWADTCLPLMTGGPAVVTAKARLLARLADRGCGVTHEADAHFRVDGLRVKPIRLSGTRLAFVLPPGGREILLRSRSFAPAYTKAESDDLRTLGLCVAGMQIDGATAALWNDEACKAGWHEGEYDGDEFTHRWTNGSTPLPAGARIVIVDLAGAGRYWSSGEDRLAALSA
jgi:microcystin-dependent protein